MPRPADWDVLELADDPTPGEPGELRALARRWEDVADDAAAAAGSVRALLGDGALVSWVGEAAGAFSPLVGELPEQLDRCARSYRSGAAALATWATDLAGAQHDADQALARGRQARARLESLEAQLDLASGGAASAARQATSLQEAAARADGAPPGAGTPAGPDPGQVAAAVRRAQEAQARVRTLESSVGDARAELDLARRLALEARSLREDRGRAAASRVREAADEGIPPRSWWDRVKEVAAAGWRALVVVATVVVVVLGVIALIVGGPIAWVVFAAGVVLMVDALLKYSRGEATLVDLGLAALGLIPGVRGLTTVGAIRTAFRAGGGALRGGAAVVAHVARAGARELAGMAGAVRALGAGAVTRLRSLAVDAGTGLDRLADGALARLRDLRWADDTGAVGGARAGDTAGDVTGSPFVDGNQFLGPTRLPDDPRVRPLLEGYDPYAGLSPREFAERYGAPPDFTRPDWSQVPGRGFDGDVVVVEMRPGEVLDRFGGEGGAFLSPEGTAYAERSLPPLNLNELPRELRVPRDLPPGPYFRYEVLRPFDAQVGYVAPAFGQPGGGLQVLADPAVLGRGGVAGTVEVPVELLVDAGYLRRLP